MMITYKVRFRKDSSFQFYGETYFSYRDYWTTVKLEDSDTEAWVKHVAKKNLMIQVSKDMVGHAGCWKRVYLDNSDIDVVEA